MKQTITLDTSKAETPRAGLFPLRRGERNNVDLTVAVRSERRTYDLAGMTAHLVWQAADGKLVGPIPMEVDTASDTVRCTLPDACYSAVGATRAYVELRRGSELVDTTGELSAEVIECIDPDAEQAEEYKPLVGEVRDAVDAANSKVDKAVSDAEAAIKEAKAIPRFDLSAMGAQVGQPVKADTRSLYKALTSGVTRCTMDFMDVHFEWNALAIEMSSSLIPEAVEFSHVFMLEGAPALVWVSVINGESGEINVKLVLLAEEAS